MHTQEVNFHTQNDKRTVWPAFLAGLVFILSVLPDSVLAEKKADKPAVETLSTVIVNGVPLTEGEVSREINRLAPVTEYHTLSKERWKKIRKKAIDNVVEKELFYREALQRGIVWDEQWVEYIYEKNRKQYDKEFRGAELFDDEKVKNRLYNDLRRTYVISKLWQRGKKLTVPDKQEVEKYFNDNRDKYKSPEAVKVVELLLPMKPSATKKEWDAARKKINKIYRKVKKDKGFAAYKNSKSISITEKIIHEGMQGYDVKRIGRLADNEIDKPVFSLRGYGLIKKVKTIPSIKFSFAEVEEQVKTDLHNLKYRQWLDSLRYELRDKSKIVIGAGPAYVGK